MSLNRDKERIAIMKVVICLNEINLLSYLEKFKGKTVRNMMNELEKDYPYEDEYSKSLFDVFSEDNFVFFLNMKYKLNLQPTTITDYFI